MGEHVRNREADSLLERFLGSKKYIVDVPHWVISTNIVKEKCLFVGQKYPVPPREHSPNTQTSGGLGM